MLRGIGLFLLVVGLLLAVAGLILLLIAVIAPAGPLGSSIVIFAIMLLVGALLAGVGFLLMRGAKPGDTAVDGVNGYRFNVAQARELEGAAYVVCYQPPTTGKNATPSSLLVSVPAVAPTTLQFNPKNWYDRWCLQLGIVPARPTGDAEFDEAVYVRGPISDFAEQCR
jgi:hypothetical protein